MMTDVIGTETEIGRYDYYRTKYHEWTQILSQEQDLILDL